MGGRAGQVSGCWGAIPPPTTPGRAEQTAPGATRPSRYAVAYGEPGNPAAGPLPNSVGSTATGWQSVGHSFGWLAHHQGMIWNCALFPAGPQDHAGPPVQ